MTWALVLHTVPDIAGFALPACAEACADSTSTLSIDATRKAFGVSSLLISDSLSRETHVTCLLCESSDAIAPSLLRIFMSSLEPPFALR